MSLVLGGGVSGLAACHYLLSRAATQKGRVTLIEATDRVGGWIRSTVLPGGVLFEHGPRTVRPAGPQGANTLALVDELGLSPLVQPIPRTHPAALNRMVYVGGRLHRLPSSLASLFVTLPPFSRPLVAALWTDLTTPRKTCGDESIYSFVERRLGKELADYAISPMICGICAGDAKQISVKFLMKSLFDAEQQHGSITRGLVHNMLTRRTGTDVATSDAAEPTELQKRAAAEKWSVWSLKGGLERLTDAMRDSVEERGAELRLSEPCTAVTFTDSGATVTTLNAEHKCDHVYSSIPANRLSGLVALQHPELAELLAAIPTVTVAVVNLKYRGRVLPAEAFGFLIPPAERIPLLGVIFDSCCFPCGDDTVLTAMLGGAWFRELFPGDGPELAGHIGRTAATHIRNILGIESPPERVQVSVLEGCIPQYLVGHQDRVQGIRDYIRRHRLPMSVVGASYEGVGVNDVIMSARRAVLG